MRVNSGSRPNFRNVTIADLALRHFDVNGKTELLCRVHEHTTNRTLLDVLIPAEPGGCVLERKQFWWESCLAGALPAVPWTMHGLSQDIAGGLPESRGRCLRLMVHSLDWELRLSTWSRDPNIARCVVPWHRPRVIKNGKGTRAELVSRRTETVVAGWTIIPLQLGSSRELIKESQREWRFLVGLGL
jgi:hypothetical protein